MKIAEFCIRHKVTTILIFVMIVIFGLMSFSSLALALLPNMEFPMAVVYAVYAGAGPKEIEELVTKPLESACATVSGMKELASRSSENMGMIMVTFADGTNMDMAALDLREKIDLAKSRLPDDCSAPTVMTINPDMMPVAVYALTGRSLVELQSLAQDVFSPALERIDGVASVEISGGVSSEVAVVTRADRMAGYNLSISYLSSILSANNLIIPAGTVQNGTGTLTVRTDAQFSSLEDIKATLIPLPTGGNVRLDELAEITLRQTDPSNIAKVDGNSCVLLTLNKQSDVNTVQVARSAKKAIDNLKNDYPNVTATVVMDQSDYVNLAVNSAVQNIILGVILAALVLLFFLHDAGATTVIAISMPVCIISVFLIMDLLDITLNIMSLGGIAMGVGMIVDNSIVVLENIFTHRSDGKDRWRACIDGAAEISLSISASTLTTVVVFLPIGLSKGMSGQIFGDFCLTIAALLLSSLFIALTLVPLLCYFLLDRSGKSQERLVEASASGGSGSFAKRAMERYRSLLAFLLKKRWVAVIVSLALVCFFGIVSVSVGAELLPDMDQGAVTVDVSMPLGSELVETAAIADRISPIILENVPELDDFYYSASSSSASFVVNLVELKDRQRSAREIADDLRTHLTDIAGCSITVDSSSTASMLTGSQISVRLTGDDYDRLSGLADQLVQRISQLPDAINVESSAARRTPQVNIAINREKAAGFGLTPATIGAAVRSELTGASSTTLHLGGKEIEISIKGDSVSSTSLDALRAMPLSTPYGFVPLELVADVEVELAPLSISRRNQSRVITVSGSTLSGDTVAMTQSIHAILENFPLPEGYFAETSGSYEDMVETFRTLGRALIIAIGLVYFVLASQFESFLMPIIIMMVLPIAFLGGVFGLPVTGQKISMVAIIGIIMLSGVVVNACIVLVDYINIRRSRGEPREEAILNACPRRVRPVLMTTLTTILGLMPMVFDRGEGAELMAGMAIVMVVGMLVSTVVTLFFTPIYYSLLDDFSHLGQRRREKKQKKKQGGMDTPEPALSPSSPA
ncbi:MAG: efflux RND transporter permease subunit [Clostridia bacterium]|nr:efflux RND transporter permease subunit [Clostridia bacterium]